MVAYYPERLLQNPICPALCLSNEDCGEQPNKSGGEADKADFLVPVSITNPEEGLNLINTARTSLIST
jgi:hypothetical protein